MSKQSVAFTVLSRFSFGLAVGTLVTMLLLYFSQYSIRYVDVPAHQDSVRFFGVPIGTLGIMSLILPFIVGALSAVLLKITFTPRTLFTSLLVTFAGFVCNGLMMRELLGLWLWHGVD